MSSPDGQLTRPTQSNNLQAGQAFLSAGRIAHFFTEPRPLLKVFSLSFVVLVSPIFSIVYYIFVVSFIGWDSYHEVIAQPRVRGVIGMIVLFLNTMFSFIIALIYKIRTEEEKYRQSYALLERPLSFFINFSLNILASSNIFFSIVLINLMRVKGIITTFEELLALDNLFEVLIPILRDSFVLVVLGTIIYHALSESETDNDGNYRIKKKPGTYFFYRTLLILEIAGLGYVFYKSYKSADASDLEAIFARNFLDGSQSFSSLCWTLKFSFPGTVILFIAFCIWHTILYFKEEMRRDNEEMIRKQRHEKKREKRRKASLYPVVQRSVLQLKQTYSLPIW